MQTVNMCLLLSFVDFGKPWISKKKKKKVRFWLQGEIHI